MHHFIVYLRLIHAAVWQKPTQYRKEIILQLKINKLKKINAPLQDGAGNRSIALRTHRLHSPYTHTHTHTQNWSSAADTHIHTHCYRPAAANKDSWAPIGKGGHAWTHAPTYTETEVTQRGQSRQRSFPSLLLAPPLEGSPGSPSLLTRARRVSEQPQISRYPGRPSR